MARTVREASLATRSERLRLAINTKPYWRVIEQGLHLGYRRRETGGTWIARRRDERGIYREAKLGLADDLQDANGDSVLDFSQAQRAARAWCLQQQRLACGLDAQAVAGPYTERHYAHLAPNYVADTIRANFPRLTESTPGKVVRIAHQIGSRKCRSTDDDFSMLNEDAVVAAKGVDRELLL